MFSPVPLAAPLPLSLQLAWLLPMYGFSGMVLVLPWAAGWFPRNGQRPAAYLTILFTVLAVLHGSLALWDVWQGGPHHLSVGWFRAADLDLRIGFDLSLTSLAALQLVTGAGERPKAPERTTTGRGGRAGEEERTVGGDVRGVLDREKSGGWTGLIGLGSSGLAVELAGGGAV
ncbi:MAG: hypothetical protein ACKOPS_20015 [Cyanobium sp.]